MSAAPKVRLSIYDLDRTITSLPTWTPFLLDAALWTAPWRLAFAPLLALTGTNRDRRKERMHRLMLGARVPADRMETLTDRFAERIIRTHIRPGARAQLSADRAEGRRIVIATAAHGFYARGIADRLGVFDLVATEARRGADDTILPQLAGPNCYGAAKQAMLADWLQTQGMARADAHIRFHSDHVSDAPTFDWADDAIAVNPHAPLRDLAATRGWRCVDWSR